MGFWKTGAQTTPDDIWETVEGGLLQAYSLTLAFDHGGTPHCAYILHLASGRWVCRHAWRESGTWYQETVWAGWEEAEEHFDPPLHVDPYQCAIDIDENDIASILILGGGLRFWAPTPYYFWAGHVTCLATKSATSGGSWAIDILEEYWGQYAASCPTISTRNGHIIMAYYNPYQYVPPISDPVAQFTDPHADVLNVSTGSGFSVVHTFSEIDKAAASWPVAANGDRVGFCDKGTSYMCYGGAVSELPINVLWYANPGDSHNDITGRFDMSADVDGTLHIAYLDPDYCGHYGTSPDGSTWTTAQVAEGPSDWESYEDWYKLLQTGCASPFAGNGFWIGYTWERAYPPPGEAYLYKTHFRQRGSGTLIELPELAAWAATRDWDMACKNSRGFGVCRYRYTDRVEYAYGELGEVRGPWWQVI